jgi:hypothetical protein
MPAADVAPVEPFLTGCGMNHLVTYLRLLNADAHDADWKGWRRSFSISTWQRIPSGPGGHGRAISRVLNSGGRQ